jgi:hypothetical protein
MSSSLSRREEEEDERIRSFGEGERTPLPRISRIPKRLIPKDGFDALKHTSEREGYNTLLSQYLNKKIDFATLKSLATPIRDDLGYFLEEKKRREEFQREKTQEKEVREFQEREAQGKVGEHQKKEATLDSLFDNFNL